MLKGPCKGQVEFQIKGTLKAPTDKASTINVYYWIAFQYIDQLILTGGGNWMDKVSLLGMCILAM